MVSHLSASGLGLTSGTNLFAGALPDAPERAAAVFETGGIFPVQAFGRSASVVERPRIQIVTRAKTYQSGRMLAHNIWRTLNAVRGLPINGVTYHLIAPVQSPFAMGEDGSGRMRFAANFDVIKDEHTSTST